MGERGPKAAPTVVKLFQGETRPSRLNLNEPQPAPTRPRRPRDLAADARAVWNRVVRELEPSGVLRGADRDTLRVYVEAVARYEHAQGLLTQTGPLIRGRRGQEMVKNPLHQIVRDNAQQVLVLARELGLTPASRAGMRGPEAGAGVGGVGWLETTLPPRARFAGDAD